ncbi:MAG: malate dehydrogenase, partial [Gammaproteobacteria bacterium]
MQKSVTVLITGAAGQIGYAMLPRLASGEVFGADTRVNLRLVEIPAAVKALEGVRMELQDCSYPQLGDISCGSDIEEAAHQADWALLVGSVPRGIIYNGKKLEERSDLLAINGQIFVSQGTALGKRAASNCRVLVVGNPANTNCLIGQHYAHKAGGNQQIWMAMTQLDANRARSLLAQKANCSVADIKNLAIWGNHSPTMYPDAFNAQINGASAADAIGDADWIQSTFIAQVGQRGKAVIDARGASSAFSAANAALDTVKNLQQDTPQDDCINAAIASQGEYGIAKGLV